MSFFFFKKKIKKNVSALKILFPLFAKRGKERYTFSVEILGNIFAGIFAVIGAFFLFFFFAILLTLGIALYVWYRIKKQFRETLKKECGHTDTSFLHETIIDVEAKEKK